MKPDGEMQTTITAGLEDDNTPEKFSEIVLTT